MKPKFSDRRILKILSDLKNIESHYPARMLRTRRQTYLRQIEAAVSLRPSTPPKRPSR
ncbi:MAG: hypothetical protein AB1509_11765 [Chloroflexota bacterium]